MTTTRVHAVLQRVRSDLRGGTLRQHPCALVSTLGVQENRHRSLQILHAAMYQILRGAPTLVNHRGSGGTGASGRDPAAAWGNCLEVCGIAITNVGTASEFLAERWSTESVSRVVRAARTTQGKQWERMCRTCIVHIYEMTTTGGHRKLVRVLRLGGANRRFVLAAAKNSCGVKLFRVQRCGRT